MQYGFSYRARIPGWPHVRGELWPVEPYPATFMLHGAVTRGTLHHLNAKTAWVRVGDRTIKRHLHKHQVRW